MFKPNPILFDPVARIENAARRAMNIMCTGARGPDRLEPGEPTTTP